MVTLNFLTANVAYWPLEFCHGVAPKLVVFNYVPGSELKCHNHSQITEKFTRVFCVNV